MNLLEKIGLYFLKQGFKPSAHKRKAVNLSNVERLVVIASGKTEEEVNNKFRHYKIIQTNWAVPQIDFWVYMPVRKLPDWAEELKGVHLITKKETNWYKKPLNVSSKTQYDLLIDLDQKYNLTSLFLAVLLKAKMKVCTSNSIKEPYFDFFINTPENASTAEYLKQAEHYLRILNSK